MTFTIPVIEKNLAPLRSAIGMLECWNTGLCENGTMFYCQSGFDMDIKNVNK
jgi:hypothetical protein